MEEILIDVDEPFIEESVLVEVLCKLSSQFERFYQEERKRYDFPILWIWKPDLEGREAFARVIRTSKGKIYKIYFRNHPKPDNILTFAHEIGHLIRAKEGKSLKIKATDNSLSDLTTDLMSMLEDSIVDSQLNKKYNFDLLPYYKRSLKRTKEQLKSEPVHKSLKFVRAVRLCNLKLRWNLIPSGDSRKEWCDFLEDCKINSPTSWRWSEVLLSIIVKHGRETIEQHKAIFSELVETFPLKGRMEIIK